MAPMPDIGEISTRRPLAEAGQHDGKLNPVAGAVLFELAQTVREPLLKPKVIGE